MALASSVTGTGKLMTSSNDAGEFSQTIISKKSDGTTLTRRATTTYTDVREERKWYAITEAALDTWKSANPTAIFTASLSSEFIGGYDLIVTTVTRTYTGYTLTEVTEDE